MNRKRSCVYTSKDAVSKDKRYAGLKAAAEGWTSFIQYYFQKEE